MAAKKFLSPIDMTSQKIVNLQDGSAASDAATYGQLLNMLNGLDFKESVRAASTGNVDVTSPGTSVDGVTLANGDRVLLKNQTDATQNGVYVYKGATSAMTRAADGVQGEITAGATFVATEGTVNAAGGKPTQWTLATPDPITVGTTALSFVQSGAPGQSGTSYSAGSGISILNGIIAVLAGTGIVVNSGGVSVDFSTVVRKYAVDIGDTQKTSIPVTHGLNTKDVTVAIFDNATGAEVETDIVHSLTDPNTVTLNFANPPGSAALRVVVHG